MNANAQSPSSTLRLFLNAGELHETFKGWMANMKEAISKREEKKRLKKEATYNQFFDLTNKAIEVEESMTKAKPIEAEATCNQFFDLTKKTIEVEENMTKTS
jgi:hypothetical protein